jgi:hypothetical protein
MNKKGFSSVLTLFIVVIILAVLVGAIIFLYPHDSALQHPQGISTSTAVYPQSTSTSVSNKRPICSLSVAPSTISAPESTYLKWNCQNASTCSITSDQGQVFSNQNPTSGTLTINPTVSTNYTLICRNANQEIFSSTAKVILQDGNTCGGPGCE